MKSIEMKLLIGSIQKNWQRYPKTMITLRWPKCFGKLVASSFCCPGCIYRGNHTSRFFLLPIHT